MRTKTKVWLIFAAALVLAGCILFAGIMTRLGWDFARLETANYETNTYEITQVFDSISVNSDTADITFVFSEDGKCRVECYEEEGRTHCVAVEDGTLTLALQDAGTIFDYVGIHFRTPKITVCLPQTEYASLLIRESTGDIHMPNDFHFGNVEIALSTGDVTFCASAKDDLKIHTDTGDIRVANVSAAALHLSVSTGRTELADVTCGNLTSVGDTGDITLTNVLAAEKLSIERSTGDVRFASSDASEIFVKTDTGDVAGTLLTDKVFITQTDTGSVDVPKTVTGGQCEIVTDTGDIMLEIL